jgi:hypothetical protein
VGKFVALLPVHHSLSFPFGPAEAAVAAAHTTAGMDLDQLLPRRKLLE